MCITLAIRGINFLEKYNFSLQKCTMVHVICYIIVKKYVHLSYWNFFVFKKTKGLKWSSLILNSTLPDWDLNTFWLFQRWNLKPIRNHLLSTQLGNLPDRHLSSLKGKWSCSNQTAFLAERPLRFHLPMPEKSSFCTALQSSCKLDWMLSNSNQILLNKLKCLNVHQFIFKQNLLSDGNLDEKRWTIPEASLPNLSSSKIAAFQDCMQIQIKLLTQNTMWFRICNSWLLILTSSLLTHHSSLRKELIHSRAFWDVCWI